jgi:small subunit ribosomal protein S21
MIIVHLKNNEPIDKALKTLKSKVIKTKQSQELFSRKEFEKKSIKRRNQILKAIYNSKKNTK